MRLRKLLFISVLLFSFRLSYAQAGKLLGEVSAKATAVLTQTASSGGELAGAAGAAVANIGKAVAPPAAVRFVHDSKMFFTNLANFGEQMSSQALAIANAEMTLNNIIGMNSIFGQVYRTAEVFAPYISYLDIAVNAYDALDRLYSTGKKTYGMIEDMVRSGQITALEATLLLETISDNLTLAANTGKFIENLFLNGGMSVKDLIDFINDFVKITKLKELALKGLQDELNEKIENKQKDDAIAETQKQLLGSADKNKKQKKEEEGILSQRDRDEIMKEAGQKTLTPEEIKKEAFTTNFWTSFCNFLTILYVFMWMLYVAWTFIREKGNVQNRDRWIKILMGLIYGIIILVLFKTIFVKLVS